MPENGITLRPWCDDDQAGMLALEKEVWGEVPWVDPAFFDWQYRRNPAGRATIICAEDLHGTIVAQYAAMPIPLRVKGVRIPGSCGLNAMTLPNYRRLGLFTKTGSAVLDEMQRQGNPFTLGFAEYSGHVNLLGYADCGSPALLVKILDPMAFVAGQKAANDWASVAAVARKLMHGISRKVNGSVPTREIFTFEKICIEELWESDNVIMASDSKWLTWRYLENPIADYKIIVAGDPDAPDALVVSRKFVQARRGLMGYIMELMMRRETGLAAVEAVIDHALADFKAAGCSGALFMARPGSRKANLLKKCGFWEFPKKFNKSSLIIKYHSQENIDLSLMDVDVSFGMSDTL